MCKAVADIIIKAIDFVYRPFAKLMPQQIFRYGVTGSANMVLDWVLYFIFYNFVFCHAVWHIGVIAISAHIAAFCVTFPITFLTGFWLNKNIAFPGSSLKSRTQLIRYFIVLIINIICNYVFLKLFVEVCGFYPTPSKMLTTIITVTISFIMQKKYSFKQG